MNNMKDQKKCSGLRCLTGSDLKIIAMISMLIDHVGAYILYEMNTTIMTVHGIDISIYLASRVLGRIAFPIYAFLIAEGYRHTRNRKKYALNMAVFAAISEIPYNLVVSGSVRCSVQNVYFTLLLGFLMICVIDLLNDRKTIQITALAALFLISYFINSSHGYTGVIMIVVMYVLDSNRTAQALVGTSLQPRYAFASVLGFIPINMYNGERGFIKGKMAKYCFYIFYPAHLLVLYFIKKSLFGY